ncbi:fibrinogen-like protein A [Apostichopus japonicus]|uniref:fibrinogen-like protein A n=1 Tax=Stichopus japonicus TaxID=307972 RepID=UPI003AB10D49
MLDHLITVTVFTFFILAAGFLVICDGQVINPIHHGNSRVRRSTECNACFYYQEPQYPRDCEDVYDNRCEFQTQESGVYMIQPDGAPEPFNVFCNNSVDGGKWTVFQRRMDGDVDFNRTWAEYREGFGFLQREFWLGNDKLAYLTNQGEYELRIDLVNKIGNAYHAKYNLFRISDEWSKYRMVDLGSFLPESTAVFDALSYHRNMSFSTYDNDNDVATTFGLNCAVYFHGAWWYQNCYHSSLNGDYFGCDECHQSISWQGLPGSQSNIKYTEMKIRSIA